MATADLNLTRVDRLRYRPTKEAEDFLGGLRAELMPGDKATVARLALGRSLASPCDASELQIPLDAEMGNAIEGVHLFGDDADIWACLVSASGERPITDSSAFRALVEAHWHRGACLLRQDYEEAGRKEVDFVLGLAGMAPEPTHATPGAIRVTESEGPITIRFGPASKDYQTREDVSYLLNAEGTSPHLAILGKTRTGKSRTGLDMAVQIAEQTSAPMIIIDPKGEFVNEGDLVAKPEWRGKTLEDYFPGIRALDVPQAPIPLDFLWRPPQSTTSDLARLAISFRDSFQLCLRNKGDVALDTLRQATLQLLEMGNESISIDNVLEKFTQLAEDAGKSLGSIGAKLGEISSLNIFEPRMAPPEFFSHRWVIGLGSASSETKRLAMFLVLDALSTYLLSLPDSSVDDQNRRSVRHLLVVDEAREILSYKHAALSTLIRRSASKGGVIMLLSQSPDDFEQEEDDFLEQLGTVGAFASSSRSVKHLASTFGKKLRVEDFSDNALPSGVALVKIPGMASMKIRAWE